MFTVEEVKRAVRALDMTMRRDDGEWRINFVGGDEATAYYTDDLEDALWTAFAMTRERAPAVMNLHYGDAAHTPMRTVRFQGSPAQLRALKREARAEGWPLRVDGCLL